jgi:hypothetical protein
MDRGEFNTELEKVKSAADVLSKNVQPGLKGPEWHTARAAVANVIRTLQSVEQRLPKDERS